MAGNDEQRSTMGVLGSVGSRCRWLRLETRKTIWGQIKLREHLVAMVALTMNNKHLRCLSFKHLRCLCIDGNSDGSDCLALISVS